MKEELRRFLRGKSGGVVDTIIAIGIIVVVTGPVLAILSGQVSNLLQRIIEYVARTP